MNNLKQFILIIALVQCFGNVQTIQAQKILTELPASFYEKNVTISDLPYSEIEELVVAKLGKYLANKSDIYKISVPGKCSHNNKKYYWMIEDGDYGKIKYKILACHKIAVYYKSTDADGSCYLMNGFGIGKDYIGGGRYAPADIISGPRYQKTKCGLPIKK